MSKKRDDNPELRERIATLEANMKWVMKKLETIDSRTWYILGSVVALGLLSIFIALLT